MILVCLSTLLACKKGTSPIDVIDFPSDTLIRVIDTAKKPADTLKKPVDTATKPTDPNQGKQLNYLALGDSYTIGESVERMQNFPNQLVKQIEKSGVIINPPTIIARTGWTTSDLQTAIKASGVIHKFDFVTLLIGVNNQYRGESRDTYRKEFRELLQTALNMQMEAKRMFLSYRFPIGALLPLASKAVADSRLLQSRSMRLMPLIGK